jgi:hypothetical protein
MKQKDTALPINDHAYGVAVPEGLHEAIEAERDNLSRAHSLLACLAIAMEYDSGSADGAYYPDVARIARDMVKKSIGALDSLALQRLLAADRIKDESIERPAMKPRRSACGPRAAHYRVIFQPANRRAAALHRRRYTAAFADNVPLVRRVSTGFS